MPMTFFYPAYLTFKRFAVRLSGLHFQTAIEIEKAIPLQSHRKSSASSMRGVEKRRHMLTRFPYLGIEIA